MTVEQLVREADTHTGEDLGRTVFSEVRAALRAGADRDGLIAVVTTLYDHLGDAGRGEDQDAIAEVLDSLTGFLLALCGTLIKAAGGRSRGADSSRER